MDGRVEEGLLVVEDLWTATIAKVAMAFFCWRVERREKEVVIREAGSCWQSQSVCKAKQTLSEPASLKHSQGKKCSIV